MSFLDTLFEIIQFGFARLTFNPFFQPRLIFIVKNKAINSFAKLFSVNIFNLGD